MQAKELKGIIVPLFTPLTRDEEVDEKGMRKLVNYVLEGGVHAAFCNGGCGEFPHLFKEQRRQVAEIVIGEVNGRVPVIVGVGACSTKEAVAHALQAKEAGADFILSPPPYYFGLSQEELKGYFQEITAETGMPLIVYNTHASKTLVTPQTMEELSKVEDVVAIKDSSGNIANFQEVVRRTRDSEGFRALIGEDDNLFPGLVFGAHGATPAVSNIIPKICVGVYNSVKQGNMEEGLRLYEKVLSFVSVVYYASRSPMAACKTALALLGICEETITRPLLPPSEEERKEIKRALREAGVLQ